MRLTWGRAQRGSIGQALFSLRVFMRLMKLVGLLLVFATVPALAQVYLWQDEEGKTQLTKEPPKDWKPEPPRSASPKPSVSPDASTRNPETIKRPVAASSGTAIVMYTTVWCPHCAKARAYLRSRNIPFTDHDIEQSADGLAQYRKHGGRGIPLIFVGQQRMNGFSEQRMAEMLARAGY
jgi:glutaredoxin